MDALLAAGFEVRRLVREGSLPEVSPPEAASGPPGHSDSGVPPRVRRHVVDFGDPGTLARTEAFDGVTHVFHLAGVTRGITLADFRRGNVLPTESLFGALRQRRDSTLRRVVHVSSQSAAGPADDLEHPSDEAEPPAPIEPYGRSKAEAEGVVDRYSSALSSTIIRPPAVYGPGDRDFLTLFRLLRWKLSLHAGSRDNYLSLIYVEDLVQGMIDAARSPAAAGGTYFLAPPEPVRWGELYRTAATVAGRCALELDVPELAVAAAGRIGDLYGRLTGRLPLLTSQKAALARPRYWVCSSGRARRAFDFHAPTTLEEGLRTTHRWYREQGWLR